MILIIAEHYAVIGIMHTQYGEPYRMWAEGSLLNRMVTSFAAPGGDTGVGVFFLITGFFLAGSTKRRRLNGVICPVLFYMFLGLMFHLLFSAVFGTGINFKQLLRLCISPVTGFNWWFATSYVMLILLAPVINDILHGLSDKKLLCGVILTWCFWYCAGYAMQLSLYRLERAVFFYILGVYIKAKCSSVSRNRRRIAAVLFLISWGMFWFSTYLIGSAVGGLITTGIFSHEITVNILKLVRATVFAPVCSVTLFIWFLGLNMKHSPRINRVASATFGIYLMHDTAVNRELMWNGLFRCDRVYSLADTVCWHLPLAVTGLFLFGYLCELLRKKVFEKRMNRIYFRVFSLDEQNK